MDKDTEKAMFRLLSMLARMQLVEAIERRHDLAARQLQQHVLWLSRVQAKFYEPAAATPAPSALERLFDRIARMEVAQRGRVVQAEVLNMIDEEREREGRA